MSVDKETLDRLLIDRALGELSEDASALLDAFVQGNPGAALAAGEVRDTLGVVRKALGSRSGDADDTLPAPEFLHRLPRARLGDSTRGGFIGFALAASIGLLVWIGIGPAKLPNRPEGGSVITMQAAGGRGTAVKEAGFWAVDQWRRAYGAQKSRRGSRVEWTGPISRPRIGESS